jgi:hypothetical protein
MTNIELFVTYFDDNNTTIHRIKIDTNNYIINTDFYNQEDADRAIDLLLSISMDNNKTNTLHFRRNIRGQKITDEMDDDLILFTNPEKNEISVGYISEEMDGTEYLTTIVTFSMKHNNKRPRSEESESRPKKTRRRRFTCRRRLKSFLSKNGRPTKKTARNRNRPRGQCREKKPRL